MRSLSDLEAHLMVSGIWEGELTGTTAEGREIAVEARWRLRRARAHIRMLPKPVMKTTEMRICIELLARKASDFSRGRNCATVFSVARIPIDARRHSRISGIAGAN